MALTNFTGVRRATFYFENTNQFFVIKPNELSSDGIEFTIEDNTITNGTWAGDRNGFNGYNISVATLSVNPKNHYTLGAVFPQSFNDATGVFAPSTSGCSAQNVTITIEKVCDETEVVQFRHCDFSISNANTLNRDDIYNYIISFIPQEAPASDYGITTATGTGLIATDVVPWVMFDGTYDPATNTNTYTPAMTITRPTAGEITIAVATPPAPES